MDRAEARAILESMKLIDFRFAPKNKANEALDLAIEALQEPKGEYEFFGGEYAKEGDAESATTTDCISRQQAIEALTGWQTEPLDEDIVKTLNALPPVTPKASEDVEDMGEVSDGYHTFNQLYHQRAVLFVTIVNQNKDKAWKSWKHEDGKFCFDKEGEWFIVGVDTPEGSYTYHYEKKYWDMFDCEELDRGKHWDGHTEEDVTRLLSLPPVTPKEQTDCTDFINWLLEEVMDEENWELNAVADGEIICRKLKKLGLLEVKYGYYVRASVTPPERTGEWIEYRKHCYDWTKCSVCDHDMIGYETNYCPNCGAKMGSDTE